MIPMTADLVNIPIVAAGGIADARGMAAALVLGADGVYIGTRFIATHECDAHRKVKQAIIDGKDACTVSVKKWIVAGRDLRNTFTQTFTDMQEQGAPVEDLYRYLGEHTMYQALVQGDIEEGELPCGQNAGIILGLTSAAEVIHGVIADVPLVTENMQSKLFDS